MESPCLAVTVCEVELVNLIQTSHPRPVPVWAGAPRGWDSSLLCQTCSRHCKLSFASTNPTLQPLQPPENFCRAELGKGLLGSAFGGIGALRNVVGGMGEFPAGRCGFSLGKMQDGAGNLPQMSWEIGGGETGDSCPFQMAARRLLGVLRFHHGAMPSIFSALIPTLDFPG